MRPAPALALVLAFLLPLLAGCVAQPRPVEPVELPQEPLPTLPDDTVEVPVRLPPPPPPPPRVLPEVRLGAVTATGLDALVARGPALAARPDGWGAPCDPVNCARIPFQLELERAYWESRDGALEVTIAWGGHEAIEFQLLVEDAAGEVVAEGMWGEYASVALLEEAASGAYTAVVKATNRGGDFWLVVQVEPRPAPPAEPRDLLPNLKAMVPKDLSLTANNYFLNWPLPGWAKGAAHDAAGLGSCGLDEAVEAQAKRCLRFASAVGNVGEGPLEVHLGFPEGQGALAGQAEFRQRIWATDGSWREVPSGQAFYHVTHGHLHYNGLAHFQLYAYDWDARQRGEPATEGRKAGFCMVDEGLVHLGAPGTVPSNYTDLNCDYLSPGDRLMRISAGWFDMYEVDRPDQYVDVEGLADGVYELVAVADADNTVLESNEDDNEASVVFRLTGDTIEVLRTIGETGPFGSVG